MSKTCKKCNGTGTVAFSHVDGGRCWACGPKADTSYTRKNVGLTAAELDAELAQINSDMVAAQAVRRAERAAR